MQITRNTTVTAAGPSEWFTGPVYVDAVAAPSGPSRWWRSTTIEGKPTPAGPMEGRAGAPGGVDPLAGVPATTACAAPSVYIGTELAYSEGLTSSRSDLASSILW
jgi:hypothetical protein